MTTGRRFGGEECATAGIVDAVAPSADEVRAAAVQQARALAGKPGDALGRIKHRMYVPVVEQSMLGAWPADKPSPSLLAART
jgi:enoyl-CoA hydratase/carnithine racemase